MSSPHLPGPLAGAAWTGVELTVAVRCACGYKGAVRVAATGYVICGACTRAYVLAPSLAIVQVPPAACDPKFTATLRLPAVDAPPTLAPDAWEPLGGPGGNKG